MDEKTTIRDIARLAGVSTATVSRVLNQKPDVSPITREHIMRIMNEQGFIPSITAAGLAGGRNRLIGVLGPALTWPLIYELMHSIAEIVEESPYELVLYSISTENHSRNRSTVIDRILTTKLTAGLLAVFPGESAQHLVDLHQHGYPIVLVDDQRPPLDGIPWVGTDNRMGGYIATRHLIHLGHRRIAHIQGPYKYQVSHDRYRGYCDALQEAGIDLDPELVLEGDFMPDGGRTCAKSFFLLPIDKRPTAIFAASDFMAYGVTQAAQEHGLRIPEDLALVGFDDTPPSEHLYPALTTVRQPFYEMGRRAIEILLNQIEISRAVPALSNGNGHSHTSYLSHSAHLSSLETIIRVQLPASLVIRASCGAHQGSSQLHS